VDSYTVISSQGAKATISAAEFEEKGYVRVDNLPDDASCTFTVTASNANGSSAPSLPSATVVPTARTIHPPSALEEVSAFAANGMASIHFGAPVDDGGSPVIAYRITVNPGGRQVMLTGRPILVLGGKHVTFGVVDGLENGKAYTFDVAAVNAAGTGEVAKTHMVRPTANAFAEARE
jgi:Fibronectin type III domain